MAGQKFKGVKDPAVALLESLESSISAGLEASRLAAWQAGWPGSYTHTHTHTNARQQYIHYGVLLTFVKCQFSENRC